MDGYERFIKIMRAQKGKSENVFKIGTITQGLGCKTGELELFNEDLVFSEPLLTGYYLSEESFVPPIKKGDKVLLIRLSDEIFAVIAKISKFKGKESEGKNA